MQFKIQMNYFLLKGIHDPRVASDGSPLPTARQVSLAVLNDGFVPDLDRTLANMQFGQFINHDLQFTTQPSVQCCYTNGSTIPSNIADPSCLPIPIAFDDEFFNANGIVTKTCMNFVRSITGPRLDCSFGYADQVNTKSHWLDLSTIYGVDEITLKSLRLFSGGLFNLTFDATNNRYLLPVLPDCPNKACFFSGQITTF